MSTAEIYSPGLEGVIAGETAISTVEGGLRYRGYPVTELAEQATFEEVAYLLLYGELPNTSELRQFQGRLAAAQTVPPPLTDLLKALPPQTLPMDVRVQPPSASWPTTTPIRRITGTPANLRKAERLLGQIPVVIALHYRLARGRQPIAPRHDLGHAANFLYMLRGTPPNDFEARAFDVSLILYAEHEFNASTFTARVVVSTESDLHSAIVAAIGALKGRLHGGANEKVMDLLLQAGGPDTATQWIHDALARKERVMGFGHRVYKAGDVRARILKEFARKAAAATGQAKYEDSAEIIERGVGGGEEFVSEPGLASGAVVSRAGIGDAAVHAVLRGVARQRLGGARHRTAEQQPPDSTARPLHRARGAMASTAGRRRR